MPHSRYCQTKDCSNRTETDHPHCPACEQATAPPRRLHRAKEWSSDATWHGYSRARCAITGCEQRATGRGGTKCLIHQTLWESWAFAVPEPEPRLKGADMVCVFDIVCLQCAERRPARGTEAQANHTRQHLGACARCRGPLVVERADLGGISSPSRGISVTYDAGRAVKKAGLS